MSHHKTPIPVFDPAAAALRWRLWVRLSTERGPVLYVYWRRAAVLLATLALLGWLAATAGTWAWLRYRTGFAGASYANLVCPWRWDRHQRALGAHHVAQARLALAQEQPALALAHLRAGVARLPEDRAARRLLVLTLLRFQRHDAALETLLAGVPAALDDLDYLKFTCTLLQELQADDRLLALADQVLPAQPDDRLPLRYLALQAATADFERGRYDAAEDLLARWQLDRAVEGAVLLARCDWERGRPDLALLRLNAALGRFPQRDAINLELARCHRALGQHDQARRHALLRQLDDPTGPGPRIDLIYAYQDTGDTVARDRELAGFLADFAGDRRALLLLAWFGADRGSAATVRSAAAVAAAHAWPAEPFVLAEAQAELVAGNHAAAHRIVEATRADRAASEDDLDSLLTALDAVALQALGSPATAQAQLDRFLARSRPRAVEALLLARLFNGVGAGDSARRVLARAVEVDPHNQAALGELVRLEAVAGHRDAVLHLLPRLLELRKPSRAALDAALPLLNRPEDAALGERTRLALYRAPRTPGQPR